MVLPLGFLRILINALSMTTLQLTRVPPFMNIVRTIMETFTNRQSLRTQPSSHHVANVLSKINLQPTVVANTFIFKLIDTGVPISTRPRCFTGRLQFLTTAASPAPIQSTKLTQSLRLLSVTMNARALKHKSAENYQVYVLYTSPITYAMCHY